MPSTTGDIPFDAVLGVVLMEFGDFAMNRRMMRGIKARAESLAGETEDVVTGGGTS